MNELSLFIDESGGQNGISKYCLVTLVMHRQQDSLGPFVERYEKSLKDKNLPDIPFHTSPLMYGKGAYTQFTHETRHKMFSAFFVFAKQLPVKYKNFIYKRAEYPDAEKFMVRLKRDLVVFLADNIEFFQSFSTIKIYYDNGQHMITKAVHGAIDYALSKQATIYKMATPNNYRLFQLADFVCTLELTNIKYEKGESTSTDEKMFRTRATFRRNYFRHIRKLAFENTR